MRPFGLVIIYARGVPIRNLGRLRLFSSQVSLIGQDGQGETAGSFGQKLCNAQKIGGMLCLLLSSNIRIDAIGIKEIAVEKAIRTERHRTAGANWRFHAQGALNLRTCSRHGNAERL